MAEGLLKGIKVTVWGFAIIYANQKESPTRMLVGLVANRQIGVHTCNADMKHHHTGFYIEVHLPVLQTKYMQQRIL